MTPHDHLDLPRSESEFRAQRLGFALKGLAAELVAERQKVVQLRRELTQLKARPEYRRTTEGVDRPEAAGSSARSTGPTGDAR